MSGPVGYIPGLRRPIVKCPRDGWYVEDRVQVVLQPGWTIGQPHACRHCGELVPWEPETPPPAITICTDCQLPITPGDAGMHRADQCQRCWDIECDRAWWAARIAWQKAGLA
jgi:hypothetical protein